MIVAVLVNVLTITVRVDERFSFLIKTQFKLAIQKKYFVSIGKSKIKPLQLLNVREQAKYQQTITFILRLILCILNIRYVYFANNCKLITLKKL